MVKYYCIFGIDESRREFLHDQFAKYGPQSVEMIEGNNIDSLTPESISKIYDRDINVDRERTAQCQAIYPYYWHNLTLGQIACTYKHYLAISKFLFETDEEYCVIMEDNVSFNGPVESTVNRALKELEGLNWDMIFDSDICLIKYLGRSRPDKIAYRVMRDGKNVALVSNGGEGGTKGANFYILNRESAQKLYDNFLPFTTVVDFYYNYLIRKLGLTVYWIHPNNVHKVDRPSTCQ